MITWPAWSSAVPAGLRDRVASIVSGQPESAATLLVSAGAAARRVVDGAASDRDGALQLLAVDAMVTHALHEAAENPVQFEAVCQEALVSLAHIP